ncbi:hypothetical protein D3C86_1986780 [compost metagenome]
MDPFGAFLAWLQASDRDFDLTSQDLSLEHFGGQVCEVVLAHLVQRNEGATIVLRRQDEGCVHGLAS